jgi:hypothetical protein
MLSELVTVVFLDCSFVTALGLTPCVPTEPKVTESLVEVSLRSDSRRVLPERLARQVKKEAIGRDRFLDETLLGQGLRQWLQQPDRVDRAPPPLREFASDGNQVGERAPDCRAVWLVGSKTIVWAVNLPALNGQIAAREPS